MNLIERIQKLHALATRNNSTEEAAAAAAKVADLCFQNNLELESVLAQGVGTKEQYVKFDYLMPETSRADVGWKRTLFTGLCNANFCKGVILSSTLKMAVVGQKQNFEVVCYLYEYLTREVQRLAVKDCIKQGFLNNKDKRKWIQSFCEGAAITLRRRLDEMIPKKATETSDSRALVVLKDKELADATRSLIGRLQTTKRRVSMGGGYGNGKAAGAGIGIHRGVGGGGQRQIG